MNSGHSYTEGMDEDYYKHKPIAIYLNPNIMDLTKRKEELLAQKEKLEQVKKDAHQGIIAINVKLRKLESVTRDAEELFVDGAPTQKADPIVVQDFDKFNQEMNQELEPYITQTKSSKKVDNNQDSENK